MIGQMLERPGVVGEVAASALEPGHFFVPAYRTIYREIIGAYYADRPVDSLSIGAACARVLSRAWECTESEAIAQVEEIARTPRKGRALDHAAVVRRYAGQRGLLELAAEIQRRVAEDDAPEEIGGAASQTAMQLATSTVLTQEIVSMEQLGQEFVREQRILMAARKAGQEIGVYFGLHFIDSYTRGLRPTEMWFLAGEPGSGKSAAVFSCAKLFAERQMKKPVERRIGTLVFSLEMGKGPSSVRVAQSVTGLDGGLLREGRTTEHDLRHVIQAWGERKTHPLYFDFASHLKLSQVRAITVEAIRRHNVGLVIIDHFKEISSDRRFQHTLDEDEDKVLQLKQMAKDLDIVLIVLAHTTKAIESREDARPKLSHLRGSGQVAARADFVSFVYRPYEHASADAKNEQRVKRSDAEMIWAKNRWGLTGTSRFDLDASTMTIK